LTHIVKKRENSLEKKLRDLDRNKEKEKEKEKELDRDQTLKMIDKENLTKNPKIQKIQIGSSKYNVQPSPSNSIENPSMQKDRNQSNP